MSLVGDFLARYRREYDFYDQVARLVARRIDGFLRASGIRAMVTARAKHPVRLEEKVQKRHEAKSYASEEAIYQDIPDLAGVRVALYFPSDSLSVDKIVRANFDFDEPPRVFPIERAAPSSYSRRFSGYAATHYRLRLRGNSLDELEKRYMQARVELQVASLLMHAWAEVEHDLAYKPTKGELSEAEYAILDELNGLVIAGEIALERLHKALEARVSQQGRKFSSHYDLAAFLFDSVKPILKMAPDDTTLGRIDILYALLQKLDMATPEKVSPFLEAVHSDTQRRSISDQIVDLILSKDLVKYELYSKLRAEYAEAENQRRPTGMHDEALDRFMRSWIAVEQAAETMADILEPDRRYAGYDALYVLNMIYHNSNIISEIDRIQRLRNNIVHGSEYPDSEILREEAARLDIIAKDLRNEAAEIHQARRENRPTST